MKRQRSKRKNMDERASVVKKAEDFGWAVEPNA
jgi:hypothetical protein